MFNKTIDCGCSTVRGAIRLLSFRYHFKASLVIELFVRRYQAEVAVVCGNIRMQSQG